MEVEPVGGRGGREGAGGFVASAAVLVALETVLDASDVQTDVEDSTRHDGEIVQGKGADAVDDQQRVEEI